MSCIIIVDSAQVRIARDIRRRRCRGYGHVRFSTSEQANAAVESMRRFQFKEGHFLGALPSDENRTLFVGGLAEGWSADTIKALLWDALAGVQRFVLPSIAYCAQALRVQRVKSVSAAQSHINSTSAPTMPCLQQSSASVLELNMRSCQLLTTRLCYPCACSLFLCSVHPLFDKKDSSKNRSFCFVEFMEHRQAQAAYAAFHCEGQSPDISSSAPSSVTSLEDAYIATAGAADGSHSCSRGTRCVTTTADADTATALAAATEGAEDVAESARLSSDNVAAVSPSQQGNEEAATACSGTPSACVHLSHSRANAQSVATAVAARTFVASESAVPTHSGPTASVKCVTPVPLLVAGIVLKVDWADPLRYHIHLNG
eukprot:8159-Heterococcus_DN1.PRE.7